MIQTICTFCKHHYENITCRTCYCELSGPDHDRHDSCCLAVKPTDYCPDFVDMLDEVFSLVNRATRPCRFGNDAF